MSGRRTACAALLAVAAGACVPAAPELAPEPVRAGAAASGPVPAPAPATLPSLVSVEDSAADQAVLEALADLEFASLDRRAGHVRGPAGAATPAEIEGESVLLFTDGAGGPAAAAGASRLDTESFANHKRVQYYLDFFQGPARDRFGIWLGRLPRYEGMIREQLARYGVPDDFVYLAMIESGYSNTAVSRARAVGMWQFIAGTGRTYGLDHDVWVDERRDPFLATEAAARHLADLNETFGSWYLAAAAYNAGAGRVTRGLRRLPAGAGEAGDSSFFALSDRRYLRLETRDYVPKLIAAALIAKDPARYGFDSLPRLEPLRYDEVLVTASTGLDVLARLADTTTAALIELNPHFVRGVTPPERTAVVRVPLGTGATVARGWAALPPNERVTFLTHRVARGETLSGIAQRYGVSTTVLQAANPRAKARALRIGQELTVPISPGAQRAVAPTRGTRAAAPRAAGPASDYHTVRAGDSLWTLSQRYGVKVAQLRDWNDLSGSLLRVGQQLRVQAP
jgi:membrane-bound lytic murein transglycosylase D